MNPTLQGFLDFVVNQMGISTTVLPQNSPVLQLVYDTSIATVNIDLCKIPFPRTSPNFYAQAVYNLAGHLLVMFAQDQPDAAPVSGSQPPAPFFENLRQRLGLNSFVGGIVQSANDESTGETLLVPESLKNLTVADLQALQTPWGRMYVSIAQRAGYLVGLT